MSFEFDKYQIPAKTDNPTSLFVGGDYIAGDQIGRDKNAGQKTDLSFWMWTLLIGVLVIAIGYFVTEGKPPQLLSNAAPLLASPAVELKVATSTPNIKDILDRNFTYVLSSDQEVFIQKYRDKRIYGVGVLKDVSKPSDSYILYIDVGRYPVACSFSTTEASIADKIQLLQPGVEISFSGVFTGSGLFSTSRYMTSPWFVQDCQFE